MAFTFVQVLAVFALAWTFAYIRLVPKKIPGVPYNRISRFLPWGELAFLGVYQWRTGEVFSWLSLQCLKQKSSVVQLFIPSFSYIRPTVVVADLREIEDIVTKRIHEIDRAPLMHDFFGLLCPKATIGMPTGLAFKQQRRLWNSILSPGFLHGVAASVLHRTVLQLGDIWQRKSDLGEGDAFEAMHDIRMATLDAIWTMAVGSDLGLLDANEESLDAGRPKRSRGRATFPRMTPLPFYQSLSTLLTGLDWVMQGVSPRMYTWIFRHMPVFVHAERHKNRALDELIRDARARSMEGKSSNVRSALDQVLKQDVQLEHKSGSASGDEALRDELLELLITGHETTASSISWAFKYLADDPEIQGRLRSSLFAALPNTSPSNPPSAVQLVSTPLPYLDAVIAEVLRHSRTGPVSFRHAVKDCDILGHRIPAGTPIILVTAGPSYDDPDRPMIPEHLRSPSSQTTHLRTGTRDFDQVIPLQTFCPERWLKGGDFDPDAGLSLPFSAGMRGCFGRKIALLEMRLMIAMLVMRFELPRLPPRLSKYDAWDGLTRRPTCCFVRPTKLAR